MIDLLPMAGLVFGILLVGYAMGKITGLIRLWMKQRHEREYGNTVNRKLIRAFKEFKVKTERRLQHLEATIADDTGNKRSKTKQVGNSSESIEIEDKEERSDTSTGEDRNLRNMLKD